MSRQVKYIAQLFILAIMVANVANAQISPGDLAEPHADLEGMSNCVQCHEIGKKVTNNKCLSCHSEIQSLINQNRGYHVSSEVAQKDCFSCHSDHHGRKFDMKRFDENNFEHLLADFPLEGKHDQIDCRECHTPDFIQDRDLRKRERTFLGLEQACLSCHDDYHQETLAPDCKSCHSMNAFNPVTKFDHNTADFKLLGSHNQIDCIECHQKTVRNGEEFQEFKNIPFNDCKSCHNDPHNNQLPGKCAQCHTEVSFATFNGRNNFNHNATGFILKGSHRAIDCFACHKASTNPVTAFQDKSPVDENNCVSCHSDVHDNKFGSNCVSCHTETSFLSINNTDRFDHGLTDYTLEGMHLQVNCKECHTGRYTDPIDYSACINCHDDYHQGELAKNGLILDCKECHTVENGFEYSLYDLDKHQESSFPLEGAHSATPCYACHLDESNQRWTFDDIGNACNDCHLDIHEESLNAKFYPDKDCKSCHSNESWASIQFDHNSKTEWPLEGKHSQVDCRLCHFIENPYKQDIYLQNFSSLETNCMSCHESDHDDAFALNGIIDCQRCHEPVGWTPADFDHSNTRFALDGKHAALECSACHPRQIEDDKKVVVYKINKLECIDCHL